MDCRCAKSGHVDPPQEVTTFALDAAPTAMTSYVGGTSGYGHALTLADGGLHCYESINGQVQVAAERQLPEALVGRVLGLAALCADRLRRWSPLPVFRAPLDSAAHGDVRG